MTVIKQFFGMLVVMIALPILIPLVILAQLIAPKANVTRKEVLAYLKRMEAGEIDDYGWDDFLNVPIKNEELDAIRERCSEIWTDNSRFLEGDWSAGTIRLNAAGMKEVRNLILRCNSIDEGA